jgi:integrase
MLKRAKQFFRVAARRKLVSENPFADVKGLSEANEARKFLISREDAQKVLDACPDAEWRLIFALSRFGGLRCPSEHLTLEFKDVNWERERILIRSPKTGHRCVPILPELRPYLLKVFELASSGTVYVINRYRQPNANLRSQFERIIHRAGGDALAETVPQSPSDARNGACKCVPHPCGLCLDRPRGANCSKALLASHG